MEEIPRLTALLPTDWRSQIKITQSVKVNQGKYYIARKDVHFHENHDITGLTHCAICEYDYEKEDKADC